MTAEIVTVDGEVIDPPQAPITLFGTTDPVAIVERATAIAKPLADVIRQKRLFKHIGTHDYVFVEGWTLLGSMLGVFAEVEWSRATDNGWEARAVARTFGGNLVGAAEAMCDRAEPKWRNADDYSIRSMAQTRAVSKALRLPLGFIIALAGYSPTPADEVDEDSGQGARPSRRAASSEASAEPAPAPASPEVMAAKRVEWSYQYGWTEAALLQASLDATNKALGELDTDDWRIFAAAVVKAGPGKPALLPLEQEADSSSQASASEPESSVPPAAAPAIPPKPGTKEYRELPDGGARADARAYWSAERDAAVVTA